MDEIKNITIKHGKRKVKEELRQCDKDNLISLIMVMYDKFSNVKDYLNFFAEPEEKELLTKHKEKIFYVFFPKNKQKINLSTAKKIIREFLKYEPSIELVIELMLYYVECGVAIENYCGGKGGIFFSSITEVYTKLLDLIVENNLQTEFKEKALYPINKSNYKGYGFNYFLKRIYDNIYNN